MPVLSQEGPHCRRMSPEKKEPSVEVDVEVDAHVTQETDDSPPPSEYSLPMDCVTVPQGKPKPLMVTVHMEDTDVEMEVDTGAVMSIMGYSTFSATCPENAPEVKSSCTPTQGKK